MPGGAYSYLGDAHPRNLAGLAATTVPSWTNITLPQRPRHPYPYDKNKPELGGRWIQLVDLPSVPNIYANWPDPGWTAPVQRYIRAKIGGVLNQIAQWARTAMNVSINQIILHINRVIDTVFRIMDEIGDKLVLGMNRMALMVTAQFRKLKEDIMRELTRLTNLLKAELTRLTNTLKAELSSARAEIQATAKQTRDEINRTMNAAKKELTGAIGTVKSEVVDAAKAELEATRKATIDSITAETKTTIDSITAETKAAKAEITTFINDMAAALPKEVAKATAEEFKSRGFITAPDAATPAAAMPQFPFDTLFGLSGLAPPDAADADAYASRRNSPGLIDEHFTTPYEKTYAEATGGYTPEDEALFAVGAKKRSAGLAFIGNAGFMDGTE